MTTSTELLVARILQPLTRSLEEARRNLTLEVATEPDAGEGDITAPQAPFSASMAPQHGTFHDMRSSGRDIPPNLSSPLSSPTIMATAPLSQSRTTESVFEARRTPVVDGAPLNRIPQSNALSQPPANVSAGRNADPVQLTPTQQPAARQLHRPPLLRPIADTPDRPAGRSVETEQRILPSDEPRPAPAPLIAEGIPDKMERSSRAPTLLRAVAPPPDFVVNPLPSADAVPEAPHFTPAPTTEPEQNLSSPQATTASPVAPATANTPGAPQSFGVPTTRWRLKRQLTQTSPASAVLIDDTPQAGGASQSKTSASHPTASIPRGSPISRVADAMNPVLDTAWQLTDTALRDTDSNQPVSMSSNPRVNNHFHVSVALASDRSMPSDARELEAALIALLRDAARRQGLDV